MMKNEVWYVEVMGFDGSYRQQLHHGEKPVEKGAEGKRRKFRFSPVKVPENLHRANWSTLRALLTPAGVPMLLVPCAT